MNKPFLDAAIQRGDDIVMATNPNDWSVVNRRLPDGTAARTGFGQEYEYLKSKGYRYDCVSGRMVIGGK